MSLKETAVSTLKSFGIDISNSEKGFEVKYNKESAPSSLLLVAAVVLVAVCPQFVCLAIILFLLLKENSEKKT